jgi:hypothetical protein
VALIEMVLDAVEKPASIPEGAPGSVMRRAWDLGRELAALRQAENREGVSKSMFGNSPTEVFVLFLGDHSARHAFGVFSSRELAERHRDTAYPRGEIESFVLDERKDGAL